MPGLSGMISKLPQQSCIDNVKTMVEVMQHEDFYTYGMHSAPDTFTHVGWSCYKTSFTDCLPIYNEHRDIILFLAGEVFLDADLIHNLKSARHEFSDGNASYLVHLYEELRNKFFETLNGSYSGVLIDCRLKKSFLFNDRFGMHRLFVHHGKKGVFFSSEAKALLAVLAECREFDPKGLVEILTCGCTISDHSLFKDVEVLPGGALIEFVQGSQMCKTKYFDCKAWETQPSLSKEDFFIRFTETLSKAARRQNSGDMPVAVSLTGGFDSRMLMACLSPSQGSLPCYTFGSIYRDTFDVQVARQVSKACGQPHHVLVLGKEFIENLASYLERAVFVSDGYLGLPGAAELYANTLSRKIAPVRLTGNWGSELLRGVRAFKFAAPVNGFLHPDLYQYIEETKVSFLQLSRMQKVSFAAFVQAPQQSYGRIAIERSQIIPRTPFLDNDVVKCLYQAPENVNGFALSESIIAYYHPDLLNIPTDRGFLGDGGKLVRFTRRAFRQALFKAEYLVNHGSPDWFLRLENLLPLSLIGNNLLGRHKFYHFRRWMDEYLAEEIRENIKYLSQTIDCLFFRKNTLSNILDDHLHHKKNLTSEIDIILTLALTHKTLLKANS